MYENTIVCVECESEYSITILESDSKPSYCPFCSSSIEPEEDED